jgi:hypothetical protein
VERDAELGGDDPRDLGSLVVAALAQTRPVQRHGNERIRGRATPPELRDQQEPQRPAERAHAVELERVQLPIERCCVKIGRDERVDLPGAGRAGAARDRPRQTACAARRGDGREFARAA